MCAAGSWFLKLTLAILFQQLHPLQTACLGLLRGFHDELFSKAAPIWANGQGYPDLFLREQESRFLGKKGLFSPGLQAVMGR